jgi:hypothetical protein
LHFHPVEESVTANPDFAPFLPKKALFLLKKAAFLRLFKADQAPGVS